MHWNFDNEALFSLLADRGDQLAFSAGFIQSYTYGTSASTLVKVSQQADIYFEERSFLPNGEPAGRRSFNLPIEAVAS